MDIHPLSRLQLEELALHAEVLEQDQHGIKVLRLADGRYLKYFRRKRFFNRELLSPAALRFARHARALDRLQIPTLKVESLHRITGEPNTVAIYRPLPGETLRDLLAHGQVDTQLMYRTGVFIARLHRQGIMFRSLHPGNIVVDGLRIGLIDLLDMRLRPWSLSRWARRRNWWHLLRRGEDRPHLTPALIDALLAGYRDAADLPAREVIQVAQRVRGLLG